MRRLPLRARLTLAFALAMAVVLTAVGAVVYLQLSSSLEEQVDDRLSAKVVTVEEGDLPRFAGFSGDEEFAQLVGADGVEAVTGPVSDRPLITPDERRRATRSTFRVDREVDLAGEREPARLHVRRWNAGRVLVLGASLEDRDEALAGLLAAFLVGGPLALLLASAAGYALAGAALRPVEAMRRRAGEISADTAGRRLPLPEADDEVRRLGETLNAMLDRLDEGLRRERRFVADASHELRTPLASLQTELELALRRPREPGELRQALASAGEEVERLTRLAEDLLVLASAQEGGLPLRREHIAADELLGTVTRRFAGRAQAAARRLEAEAAPGVRFEGDRLRLEQALGNLVDNALRHGAGSIRLRAVREDDRVALEVLDDGAGLPEGFAARAFQPFARVDAARGRGGAGLGLSIVAAIARAHGGTASAGTAPDGSARVSVTVPSAAG